MKTRERAARGAKIGKVESLTKNGKLVAYEAMVRSGKKLAPDGGRLAHPE